MVAHNVGKSFLMGMEAIATTPTTSKIIVHEIKAANLIHAKERTYIYLYIYCTQSIFEHISRHGKESDVDLCCAYGRSLAPRCAFVM